MSDDAAMTDAMPIGAALDRALELFSAAVEQIPATDWDRPSNLAGWSVRDLVGHATGSATKAVILVEGGDIWRGPSEPADWVSERPVEDLRELAGRLHAALPGADMDAPRPSPQGEVPLRRALAFPVADLVLHSWDVRRSCGRETELPDDLLAMCEALVAGVPEEALRRPGAFGPARPAPDDATPTARLMAHLGRAVT